MPVSDSGQSEHGLHAGEKVGGTSAVLHTGGLQFASEKAVLESRPAQDRREITANTLWPKPKIFHIPLTGDNLAQLRHLAEKHAEPEVADHLVVYRREDVLLWAHDAGYGYVRVARDLSESIVEALRDALGDAIRNTR
jgi:hypothetical protein